MRLPTPYMIRSPQSTGTTPSFPPRRFSTARTAARDAHWSEFDAVCAPQRGARLDRVLEDEVTYREKVGFLNKFFSLLNARTMMTNRRHHAHVLQISGDLRHPLDVSLQETSHIPSTPKPPGATGSRGDRWFSEIDLITRVEELAAKGA